MLPSIQNIAVAALAEIIQAARHLIDSLINGVVSLLPAIIQSHPIETVCAILLLAALGVERELNGTLGWIDSALTNADSHDTLAENSSAVGGTLTSAGAIAGKTGVRAVAGSLTLAESSGRFAWKAGEEVWDHTDTSIISISAVDGSLSDLILLLIGASSVGGLYLWGHHIPIPLPF